MKRIRTTLTDLRNLYGKALTVRWVAEELQYFDAPYDSHQVQAFLKEKGFDVVGIRYAGCVTHLFSPATGRERRILGNEIMRYTDSLFVAFEKLSNASFAFVAEQGIIHGIVTRADLQKIPVRMWLFGLISLLEMHMTQLTRRVSAWQQSLKPVSLKNANRTYDKLRRVNQDTDLVECLQIGDKANILSTQGHLIRQLSFHDAQEWSNHFTNVIHLRNDLAHANKVLTYGRKLHETVHRTEQLLDKMEQINRNP
jgi:hypothetical protein